MKNIPERAEGNGDSGSDNSGKSSFIHILSSDWALGLMLGRADELWTQTYARGPRKTAHSQSGTQAWRLGQARWALVEGAALRDSATLPEAKGFNASSYSTPHIFAFVSWVNDTTQLRKTRKPDPEGVSKEDY